LKVNLNLASHPFGRTRLFWLFAGGSAAILTLLAIGLVTFYVRNHELSPELVTLETQLRSQLQGLQTEESGLRQKLSDPGNEQVLERSAFLNQLLYRKGISWTRTFGDLEEVFPPRVRMIQVQPEVSVDNKVLLDMTVGAETRLDIGELLTALEESERFAAPVLRGSAPPTENDPVFKYRIFVRYEQQL
jgi:type IV pilus assembly protein PilN